MRRSTDSELQNYQRVNRVFKKPESVGGTGTKFPTQCFWNLSKWAGSGMEYSQAAGSKAVAAVDTQGNIVNQLLLPQELSGDQKPREAEIFLERTGACVCWSVGAGPWKERGKFNSVRKLILTSRLPSDAKIKMSEHTRTRLSFSAILEPQKLSIDVSEQRKKNAQSGRGKKTDSR